MRLGRRGWGAKGKQRQPHHTGQGRRRRGLSLNPPRCWREDRTREEVRGRACSPSAMAELGDRLILFFSLLLSIRDAMLTAGRATDVAATTRSFFRGLGEEASHAA